MHYLNSLLMATALVGFVACSTETPKDPGTMFAVEECSDESLLKSIKVKKAESGAFIGFHAELNDEMPKTYLKSQRVQIVNNGSTSEQFIYVSQGDLEADSGVYNYDVKVVRTTEDDEGKKTVEVLIVARSIVDEIKTALDQSGEGSANIELNEADIKCTDTLLEWNQDHTLTPPEASAEETEEDSI